jgi:glucose/arabinose dehydrogenase
VAKSCSTPSSALAVVLAASIALAGCGGGGGGGGGGDPPAPPPANRPPVFTNAGPVNFAEDATGAVFTATASDPDNNPLTFALSGGADQGRFQITTAGALTFREQPDFENPADADGNNAYLVQIQVSDGATSAVLDLVVNVTNAGPDNFRVRRIASGFTEPVFLTSAASDVSGRVFVVERAGRIRVLDPATGAISPTPLLDVRGQTTTDSERGLLGFAPAPDFSTTGTFYVFLTNLAGDIEVRRYGSDRNQANTPGDVILTIPHPNFGNHNGGWIGFSNGLLYIATGDGGGAGDPANNAQNVNALLGKMLRIDPSVDSFPADPLRDYAIPAGNPFAAAGGRPEIWAYGLRNPFRNSFDPLTGNLWIGDVGQGAIEEVDLMRPTDGGVNFGWRVVEGTQPFTGPALPSFTPPVAEYGHGNGPRQGNSITGGIVYRGPVESLRGQYIFGDFITGNLWSFPISRAVLGQTLASSQFTLRNAGFTPAQGTINNPVSFGVDRDGNLYIVDIDGEIYRLEAA